MLEGILVGIIDASLLRKAMQSCSGVDRLFRNILTNEPQAVSRTFLDVDGRKIKRKFLGHVGGAAIKAGR